MLSLSRTPYRFVPLLSPAYRRVRRAVRGVVHQGDLVRCPVCEHAWGSWTGGSTGECPGCGSLARHRMLWLALERNHAGVLESAKRILHFAAEPGLADRLRSRTGDAYTTADLGAPDADVHTDITKMSFGPETFDVILCCHVLEHILDDACAMAELHRVLAPGGLAFVMVPYVRDRPTDEDPRVTDPRERARRWGQHDHVRLYGNDLRERLGRAGFHVREERLCRDITETERTRFGLWDDVIFVCEKIRPRSTDA